MIYSFLKTEHFYRIHAHLLCFFMLISSHKERHYDILNNRICRYQMIVLKNKTYLFISDTCKFFLFHRMYRKSVKIILTLVKKVHAANNIHQCRLAWTRRTKNRNKLTLIHGKINIFQNMERLSPHIINFININNLYLMLIMLLNIALFINIFIRLFLSELYHKNLPS